jgi:hypothetical protein
MIQVFTSFLPYPLSLSDQIHILRLHPERRSSTVAPRWAEDSRTGLPGWAHSWARRPVLGLGFICSESALSWARRLGRPMLVLWMSWACVSYGANTPSTFSYDMFPCWRP